MTAATVHLGFEVGSGAPVVIPLAHTFVTGQTQLSGKTTTLQAIAARSGKRALAFVTKRGEQLDGQRVRPYLPREGDKQIHWRLVETIMASALGQRNLKWERGAIVTAAKGATTLKEVRANVARLREKHRKNAKTEELYMLLGEYLDLVLPEMAMLNAADTLELGPGLNVMDIAGAITAQTQGMVIRAALEYVNHHERDVLTILPEAWEFAPRDRGAPAKDEAIAMARKGAVLGNFLFSDSQDIAGVDTAIRQATSVWILGVQRELNELKRTIQMIPAGIKRPKAEDVATLELGQFYACWGRHAVKTYVQPTWMHENEARDIATGALDVGKYAAWVKRRAVDEKPKEDTVTKDEADALRRENERLKDEIAELRRDLHSERYDRGAEETPPPAATMKLGNAPVKPKEAPPQEPVMPGTLGRKEPAFAFDVAALEARILAKVLDAVSAAGATIVQVTPPEKLRADFQREEVERLMAAVREFDPLTKRVFKLLEAVEGATLGQPTIAERLGRSYGGNAKITLNSAVKQLVDLGAVESRERVGVRTILRDKIAGDLATYQATAEDIEQVYQRVLFELATTEAAAA